MNKLVKTSLIASTLFISYYLYSDEDLREDTHRMMKKVRRKIMRKII